jgi:parallel beta-helix repeat protein
MERISNRVAWALVGGLSMLLIAALAGVVRGGPLDPPGPVAPTGKTVITSLPFTINQEGSYVLNGNLTGVASQSGITVAASNVTIDLQGFELIGVNSALAGVSASNSFVNVAVRNGTVRGWPGGGIALAGLSSQVEDIRVHSNGGIGISAGAISTVSDSIATTNGGTEILVGERSTLENCTAAGNGTAGNGIEAGDDSVITGCTASNNGGSEIIAGVGAVLENCVADGNLTAGDGISVGGHAVVRGCAARNNGTNSSHAEIRLGGGSLAEDCEANGYNGSGPGAGVGINVGSDSVVRGCGAQYNLSGILAEGNNNYIESNHVSGNSVDGIQVLGTDNIVKANNAVANTGVGIDFEGQNTKNRIEANHVSANVVSGIRVVATLLNVGLMNTATGNGAASCTDDYSVPVTNVFPTTCPGAGTTPDGWTNVAQ